MHDMLRLESMSTKTGPLGGLPDSLTSFGYAL